MDYTQLGLSEKESMFYNQLITKGPLTVKMLSVITGEQRTNCYIILNSLEDKKLIDRDDLHSVLRFYVKDPTNLKSLLIEKQNNLNNVNKNLTHYLPKLQSLFKLSTQNQGVSLFEDLAGYQAVQEDMLDAKTIKSFISHSIPIYQPEVFKITQQYVKLRCSNNIKSYFLTCPKNPVKNMSGHLMHENIEVKLAPNCMFEGEITIYKHKIALTSYNKERLSTIVINDQAQLKTFQSIFSFIWENAQPL